MKAFLPTSILALFVPRIIAGLTASAASLPTSLFSTPTSASSISAASLLTEATTTDTALDSTITLAPEFNGDVSARLQEKWHLTTFWSCNTFDQTYVACGW